jgi:glycosyltransferase involved in cell wall biosynthesis
MKFTVAIPTYNRLETLKNSINSVLKQNYHNYEILIIDDASTDNTECIQEIYLDNRIKYYKNSINIGLINNFNKCVEKSSGDYFCWLSDDDYFNDENYLSNVAEVINNCPGIGLIYGGRQLVNVANNRITQSVFGKNKFFKNASEWWVHRNNKMILNISGVFFNNNEFIREAIKDDLGVAGWGYDDYIYSAVISRAGGHELREISVTMSINTNDTYINNIKVFDIIESSRKTRKRILTIIDKESSALYSNAKKIIENKFNDNIFLGLIIKKQIQEENGSLKKLFKTILESDISIFSIFLSAKYIIGIIFLMIPHPSMRKYIFHKIKNI